MKFITGEEKLWYRDKIKRNGTSREIEFDEALQEAIYKVRTGRFLMS